MFDINCHFDKSGQNLTINMKADSELSRFKNSSLDRFVKNQSLDRPATLCPELVF